ncbi:Dynein regulatory complex subunit 2 (Coiled-coil domain-containing protein 65 homolog) (Flagellar-associated protein 250) [Durusdinium trenchii]|uniref:Dynein regulatory complex subunit 2 n=1 Tax=Durusdinium trenchii TaxID=1381693 RepID=A0ABP0NBL2_9DINO
MSNFEPFQSDLGNVSSASVWLGLPADDLDADVPCVEVEQARSDVAMPPSEAGPAAESAREPTPEPAGPAAEVSQEHMDGECEPCVFFTSKRGCATGSLCAYCHLEHPVRSAPRPRKQTRDKIKERIEEIFIAGGPDMQAQLQAEAKLQAYAWSIIQGYLDSETVPRWNPEAHEQFMLMQQRHKLQKDTQLEVRNTKYNMSRIQESWLKIMRSAKTKQLKKQVEIISQNHERDVDRKDAILQMLDRDLDEAEEQHQVAVRSHLLNVDRLHEIQQSRLLALDEKFKRDVATLQEEFRIEREHIQERHALEKRELALIVEQVEREEKNREMADITDHQSQFELIRNKNIEEDHQMRSGLEEQIEETRARCKDKLLTYERSTETSTADYKDPGFQ